MPKERMILYSRLQDLIRQNRRTLLAFALPALILFAGYMTRGIFPVGNRDVLTIDLYHQYAPFLAELQEKYTTGGSLFYSWAGGLGVNFLTLFAYYLSSPLNLLIVLFPPAYLTEAILMLIVVKIGLAGACFFVFLRGVWRRDDLQMVAIAILYALSSYSLAYSWNIMWLDGVFLLPLVLLGLVQLIREKRYLLYTISLAVLIFSNYYISFFVIIFTVLYFPVCLFQYHTFGKLKHLLAVIGRFIVFSGLAGGLAAVLLLPTYFSLRLTSAAGDSMPSTVTNYFDLFDYLGQHFMLTSPTIRDGMPNMYCGVLIMILVPVYFFARSIPLRQKLLHLGLLLLLILSFNINILNFVWHGFHFPNQLPYRNSFVYIFLVLSMAYPALCSLGEFSGKQIGAFCASAIAVVLLAQKLNDKAPELQTLYVTIIFIVIYAAILTLNRVRKMDHGDMALALLVVVIAELMLNTLLTLHRIDTTEYYSSRDGYFSGTEVDQLREELAAIEEEEDGNFYRVEVLPPRTTNDGFMYNYNGLSIFASTMPTKPVRTFENLGYHSNGINSYKYEGSTIVLDSLFGLKYLIRRSGTLDDHMRQSIVKTSEIEVFKNAYALPIGYVGLPALTDWNSSNSDPFVSQNRLVADLAGGDNVFKPLDKQAGELTNMTFTSSGTQYFSYRRTSTGQESCAKINIINEIDQQVYLYMDVPPNKPSRGYVMIDDQRVDFNATRSTLIDIGFVPAGAKVEFNLFFASSSSETGQFELYAYGLDQTAFEQAFSKIQEKSLQISTFSDTKIVGTVACEEDGVFMLSVPYDAGWHVQVDGEPVKTTALDGGLLSFEISAGLHKIEMNYVPEWFFVGLLISLTSLLILLVLYHVPGGPGRRSRNRRAAEQAGIRTVEVSADEIAEPAGPELMDRQQETDDALEPDPAAAPEPTVAAPEPKDGEGTTISRN